MTDRTTKALLLLIFLALMLNAFVMLVGPSRAADGQVGRYAISAYGFGYGDEAHSYGYYKVDTQTGRTWHRRGTAQEDLLP